MNFLTCIEFQNPEKYAVRKGISRDRIEKHVQGIIFAWLIAFTLSSSLLGPHQLNIMPEISLQKVKELSHHEMIWMGEDGFLLKPLGIIKTVKSCSCYI